MAFLLLAQSSVSIFLLLKRDKLRKTASEAATHLMQVCLHELEHDVDVLEVTCAGRQADVLDLHDICSVCRLLRGMVMSDEWKLACTHGGVFIAKLKQVKIETEASTDTAHPSLPAHLGA